MSYRELEGVLNQLAGTRGLGEEGAANVWAGTKGLSTLGALNVKAHNAAGKFLGFDGVCNELAGTKQLAGVGALNVLAGNSLGPLDPLPPSGPSLVQAAIQTGNANLVLTPGTRPANGNLAIVVGYNVMATMTPPAGWTQVFNHNVPCCCNPASNCYVWYKNLGASEPASYTFDQGPVEGNGVIAYFEFTETTHTPVSGDVLLDMEFPGPTSGTQYTGSATAASRLFISGLVAYGDLASVSATYVDGSGTTKLSQLGAVGGAIYSQWDVGSTTGSPLKVTWTYGGPSSYLGFLLQVY